jgi:hypothetical protein
LVPRIPEDQPFIVRPSVRKRALAFGAIVLAAALAVGGVLLLAPGGPGRLLAGVLVTVGPFATVLAGFLWLLSTGGPVLAIGPAGLWIKTRPTRGQAVWLPWESIGMISRRRGGLEKLLCVAPRDPGAERHPGAFTAFDSAVTRAAFGTGFTATLNFADRSEQEILQAVAHFSAGRVQLA